MFSGKKLLLLGFIIVLLIAIPVVVYLVQQQQQTQSKAAPATILSVVDTSTGASTKTMNLQDTATFKVLVNPGTNQVSFLKFTLTYDPTKIQVDSGGFVPNSTTFPSILSGPTYTSGTVTVTMSIGGSLDKVIQTTKEAGVLTVKAIASTNGATTKIDFGTPQVLSVGSTDTFNENVFSSATPATITIGGEETTTTTASTTTTTTAPAATATPTITPGPTGTPSANQMPSCTSLTLNGATSGTAPYSLVFTANGSDTDGTITKVTFNYGDGVSEDVTEGVNTGSISVQKSHTYSSGGTFAATTVLTDNNGGVSTASSCTQTITVAGGAAAPTVQTPTPTLAPTGPGQTIMTIGAVGTILSIVGILLFFAL